MRRSTFETSRKNLLVNSFNGIGGKKFQILWTDPQQDKKSPGLRHHINLIEKGDRCLQAINCKKKILAEGKRKVRTGKGMMGWLKSDTESETESETESQEEVHEWL
jgi:hypothetical protein